MNEKVLKTLDYDKIIDMLLEKALTPIGKEKVRALQPMSDPAEIDEAQAETADALSRIIRYGTLSCSGARDIRPSLVRLRVQSSLGIVELLNISSVLKTALRVKSYGRKMDDEETDVLRPYFDRLEPLTTLQRELDRCILSEEEIADDASPKLHSIRRKMAGVSSKIHSELNSILISNSAYLRDNVVTMRNGRYCIPVKSEYRSSVSGMIHDESGTGSTVFIEPMSVIRLNNELRQLEIDEQKEIEVILANLSAMAGDHTEELADDLNVLSHLDFVFAKASLARDTNASRPVFNTERRILLKKARHPLLDRHKVVPIDLRLGSDFYQLIVTGPNTGGKTVSLKTLGLLQLMGQSGLHIPAFDNSELAVFTEIYADIGDEQSIEQSLSTFSSHMTNIIRILDKADMDSLVLFDELCAGTDPSEGAALAISILDFLRRMQIRTMATTHYSELKLHALSEPGVENACCEFDVATLSPTYRLLIGIPGKSNAFAISQKLGLPEFIIDEARAHIDGDTERFEDVIKNLNDTRKEMEREQMRVNELRAQADRLKKDLETRESRLAAEKERILEKSRAEARQILADAKEQMDQVIRAAQKSGSADLKELEAERTRTREKLEKLNVQKEPAERKKSSTKASDLHIGDAVLIHSLNLKGTVSTLPDSRGNLFVQMGILRSQVHISDVEKLEESTVRLDGKKVKAGDVSTAGLSKAGSISAEINLIGKRVEEALPELEKYLDDAYLSHLPQVRIVHGKGSGAMRQAVHQFLKRLKYIKEFHLGEYGEGDSGVTIAVFK
ncbi:MAG: endonuclease MutS2 [Lachnospiraceae bacterium]|nr:endonuclease MutS2 [Lachnospiraceae bacterium]